jgi:hypothetical protein
MTMSASKTLKYSTPSESLQNQKRGDGGRAERSGRGPDAPHSKG